MRTDRTAVIIALLGVGIPALIILAAGLGWLDWTVNP